MATVIQKLQDERQDPNHVAPGIVAAYHTLLKQQNVLFEQQTDDLQSARRLDYVQFEAASTQFAEETRMALEYISKSATDRANAVSVVNIHYPANSVGVGTWYTVSLHRLQSKDLASA